jgi:hypothetical protein
MKPFFFALCVVFACCNLSAQKFVWQPSPGHTQVPIWPGTPPDPQPVKGPEYADTSGKDSFVAGKPIIGISNVTQPTMTVYSPTGNNTGAAVVVFPGGGYQMLAIDLEGSEVCDWLTPKGITCILLKYRVTDVGSYPKSGPYPESPMALEDAQRTIGLIRFHAPSGTSIPTKSASSASQPAAISPQPSAPTSQNACTHPSMKPTKKAAVPILPFPFIPAIFRSPPRCGMPRRAPKNLPSLIRPTPTNI